MRQAESFLCVFVGPDRFRLSSHRVNPRVAPKLYKQELEPIIFKTARACYSIKASKYLGTSGPPFYQ